MRLTIPNQLTILRILLTPLFVYLIVQDEAVPQFQATVVFVLAALTDWYDGWHARKFGVITRWGQFMDPLADKFLVAAALFIFAYLGYVFLWMALLILLRDFIVTGIRIYALLNGKPIITHVVAKWKTALQMLTIFLILAYINYHNFLLASATRYQASYTDLIGLFMWVITILTIISAVIYFVENRRLILNMFRNATRF